MKRSIKRDLSVGIGFVVLFVCLIIGSGYYVIAAKVAKKEFENFMLYHTQSIGDTIAVQLWNFDMPNTRKVCNLILGSPQITGLILKDYNMELIFNGGVTNESQAVKVTRNLFIYGDSKSVGYLEIFYSDTLWEENRKSILNMGSFIVIGVIITFSFLINILIGQFLSNPLETLKKDMAYLSSGDYKISEILNQRTEVQGIIDAFNDLVRQLKHRDKEIFDKNIVLEKEISERIKNEKDKQLLESRLIQAQKMESIGTLAGGVAHEINNPINGIMNYAQLLSDKLDNDSTLKEYADEIIHETERTAQIVKNLLIFAREENESHSPARIEDILNAVISLIQTIIRKDQIDIEINIPKNFPKMKCRSQQIQQVFMNLMTNARDSLNEKYPEYDENKKIIVYARLHEKEGRRWICTTVEDHGKGIDPDIQHKIFDPFFTSKTREIGTGLGLSISYGIMKDHHGELNFESEPGQYTRFHMDLPVDNE